jgi:uncharacterized NAD(P)/FAD-binding protein YdhS
MLEKVIVIVGAGFCGAVVAAQLLAQGRGRIRVLLVNKQGRMARGLAYGTRSEQHVLNVPAGRMSAFPGVEDDFLRFAQTQDPAIGAASFVSRQLYGEYLEHVVERAVARAAPGVSLERIVDQVRDVAVTPDGGRALVSFDSGSHVLADHVVLALGNYAPAHPRLADGRFVDSDRYVRDPWRMGVLDQVPRDVPVVLIGTGLTMLDIALELRSRGRTAPMIAISRRGLLPEGHRGTDRPHAPVPPPPGMIDGPATAYHYLRAVRGHVLALARDGVDWRDVLVALRPLTPMLWQRLDDRERGRFLRHLRPYWEVHRHRAAPRPAALLDRMRKDGELQVIAGRLVALDATDDAIHVRLRRRGATATETLAAGAVVNCTGPCTDVRNLDEPLMNALRWHRLIRADRHGLGVDVGADGALIDARGEPSQVFFAVGPLLRGRDWEATAVPELRVHAAQVVGRLARDLGNVEAAAAAVG